MENYKVYRSESLKKEVRICYDEYAENPREWDNLGTMSCFHSRYNLGDKDPIVSSDDYGSWDEMKQALIKEYDAKIVLPLYLYDHSGITMNTTGFSSPWDSGQVGFIWISAEKIKKEYFVKRITKKLLDRIEGYLINEVNTYDQYITGDVYGFKVIDLEKDEEEDSCWGFFGHDFKENGIWEHIEYDFEEFQEVA